MLAIVSWTNPAGGAWEVGGNWSNGTGPGTSDDAVIDMPGITVTHATGSHQVQSLAVNDSFNLSGGTLTVTGDLTVQNGNLFKLSGGTLASATIHSGGTILATNSASALSGVTLNGTLDVTSGSSPRVDVINGLTLNGAILVGNSDGSVNGNVHFANTESLAGSGTILLGGSTFNALEHRQ